MSLEQQLDTLIDQHGLSSISLTRIVSGNRKFWGINAQGDGFIGGNTDASGGGRPETAAAGLAMAIADLSVQRAAATVGELEAAA